MEIILEAKKKNFNLKDFFLKSKNKIAINSGQYQISYKELFDEIINLTIKIKKKKLNKVSILCRLDNSIEYIILYLTCIYNNYTIIPINKNADKYFQKKIINYLKPNFIIDKPKDLVNLVLKNKSKPKFSGALFFTSGTTSYPKGILHDYNNLINNAQVFLNHNKIKKINLYHVFPMSYMAGFLNSILLPIMSSGTISYDGQFSPAIYLNFWKNIIKYKINTLWLSPSMIHILNKIKLSSKTKKIIKKQVNYVFVGTAPFPSEDRKKFYKLTGLKCLESYGMTELLFISCQKKDTDFGAGKLLEKIKIKIKNKQMILNTPFIHKK